MSAERRKLAYIAVTARTISERLTRDVELEESRLAEDVAWLARQVAKLAEMMAE